MARLANPKGIGKYGTDSPPDYELTGRSGSIHATLGSIVAVLKPSAMRRSLAERAISVTAERVEVRVEIWRARVVYVCFRGDWMVAQARDGGRLEGRFRDEVENERREETRRSRTAASNDKQTATTSKKRQALWVPEIWDERLREQLTEEYWLYSRLGMTEVLPEGTNPNAGEISLPLRRGSDLPLLRAIELEPDMLPTTRTVAPMLNEPTCPQLVDADAPDGAAEAAAEGDNDGYF